MNKGNKIKNISLIIIMIFLVAVSFYVFYTDRKKDLVSCIARIVYIQGSITEHLTLHFIFDRDNFSGVVHLEGILFSDGVRKGFINRNIHFTFENNEDEFILTSKDIRIIKGENLSQDEIQQKFPSFYSAINNKIIYTISRQKKSGYLFLIAGTPRFFCEK